jgi:hypothetical protein
MDTTFEEYSNDVSPDRISEVAMTKPYPAPGPENRVQLIKDIRSKWTKFTETELMLVTSKDALVALVAERYGREMALREVEGVLKGRSL